jgi:hypothetical protein
LGQDLDRRAGADVHQQIALLKMGGIAAISPDPDDLAAANPATTLLTLRY